MGRCLAKHGCQLCTKKKEDNNNWGSHHKSSQIKIACEQRGAKYKKCRK